MEKAVGLVGMVEILIIYQYSNESETSKFVDELTISYMDTEAGIYF